ncbi:SDR family oxidoreductase [Alkanindiges sp. WGS2144]|uniref:SDR family oxidoreductase n=1 Tax=Alkanindiges sp. WGS2144 TaxID=3366808 RepID=UPI003753A81F
MATHSLTGKVVWITGASSGIGEALAHQFAKHGAQVVLSARRLDELERVARHLRNPEQHMILPLDVTDYPALAAAYGEVIQKKGRLDWLINNAGISQRALIHDTTEQTDRKIMEIDYFAPVAITRQVLPSMLKQGSGHVVFVSSVAGLLGTQYRASYAAAKGAIHLWANSLRAEMADQGLKVAIIFPGFVKTNVSVAALTGDGHALGTMDDAQANAMSADEFAKQAIEALVAGQEYIVIGGLKEKLGVWLSRIYPPLMYKMIRKSKVR